MIDKVLILGIRRAKELIPDFEISQMIGRCGRSYTESGEATIIVPSEDEDIAYDYINSKTKDVRSKLAKIEDLAFHFIPELKNKISVSEEDFNEWYSRSLAFSQGEKIDWNLLCEFMIENECATTQRNKLVLSALGKISCNYYLRPEQAFRMKSRVEHVISNRSIDEISVSWVLAFSKSYKDLSEDMPFQEYLSECSGRGQIFDEDSIDAFSWFCFLSQKKPKKIKNEIISNRKDADRMFGALREIFSLFEFDASNILNSLLICAKKCIPKEVSELALSFPEASRSILFELDSLGIHNKDEIIKRRFKIEDYGTKCLKEFIGKEFSNS